MKRVGASLNFTLVLAESPVFRRVFTIQVEIPSRRMEAERSPFLFVEFNYRVLSSQMMGVTDAWRGS